MQDLKKNVIQKLHQIFQEHMTKIEPLEKKDLLNIIQLSEFIKLWM